MSSFQSKLHNFFKIRKRNNTKPAMETKVGSSVTAPSYDDFEPLCNWSREEGAETLVVHIPEFKKEQLKVHINNFGTLKITGERPLSGTRWSRFCKEIKIPKNCNADEIHAKFSGGLLNIVMPKIITPVTKQDQPVPKPDTKSQESVHHSKTTESNQAQVLSKKPTLNAAEKLGGSQTMENKPAGMQISATRLRWGRKVAINVALLAMAVVLPLGAYIIYRYRSSSHVGIKPSHPLDL